MIVESAPLSAVLPSKHWVAAGYRWTQTEDSLFDCKMSDVLMRHIPGGKCESEILCLRLQLADVKSLPGVRELVRLRAREGEHHLALAHWILFSKSFAVKTLQKDEVYCLMHTCTSLAHLLTTSVFASSWPIFLNWRKTRTLLLPCRISCLSWNTLTR